MRAESGNVRLESRLEQRARPCGLTCCNEHVAAFVPLCAWWSQGRLSPRACHEHCCTLAADRRRPALLVLGGPVGYMASGQAQAGAHAPSRFVPAVPVVSRSTSTAPPSVSDCHFTCLRRRRLCCAARPPCCSVRIETPRRLFKSQLGSRLWG